MRRVMGLSAGWGELTQRGYAKSPPGLPVERRSTWMPGKAWERFLPPRCPAMPAEAKERVERIREAVVQVTSQVIEATRRYPDFRSSIVTSGGD